VREGITESNCRRSVGRPVPTRPRCARAAREGRSVGRSDPKAFLDALRAAVGRSAGPSRKRGGPESRVGRSMTLRHLLTSHRLASREWKFGFVAEYQYSDNVVLRLNCQKRGGAHCHYGDRPPAMLDRSYACSTAIGVALLQGGAATPLFPSKNRDDVRRQARTTALSSDCSRAGPFCVLSPTGCHCFWSARDRIAFGTIWES